MTASASPPSPAPRRSRLWWLLLLPVLLVAGTIGAWQWAWHSSDTIERLVRVANRYLPQPILVTGATGSLASGLRIASLDIPAGTTRVRVEQLEAGVGDWSWFGRSIALTHLSAARVRVILGPASDEPPSTPESLALPLDLSVAQLHVGELLVERDAPLFRVDDIDGELAYGRRELGVRAFAARLGENRLTLAGQLGARKPFPIDMGGTLKSRLQIGGQAEATPVQAVWRALDSLVALQLNAGITGGPDQRARGAVRVKLASFAADPLRSLSVDIEGFDPRAWFAGTPAANLTVRADLEPVAGPRLTLVGPVEARNLAPGPWDQRAIPVTSMRGRLSASTERVQLDDLDVALIRGTARGQFAIDPRAPSRWTAQARIAGVDPSSLHTQAQPWRIDGRLDVQQRDDATRLQLDLRGVDPKNRWPAALEAALAIDPARVQMERGVLRIGDGSVQLKGELLQDATQRFNVAGTMQAFDPGRLVKGLDGRLNADLAVEGSLKPELVGNVRAQLADSQLLGRPLRGRLRAAWRGDALHDVDAELAIRSAQLTARGALAGSGASAKTESLFVELRAPELNDIGVPVRGAATVTATLRGSWQAPAVDAQFSAQNLVAAEQRIAVLQGRIAYGGGEDGPLDATIELREHRHPSRRELSLQDARVTANGTLRRHRITFEGVTTEKAKLSAAARAELDTAAPLWRAQIEALDAGGAFATRLDGAAPLELRADGGSVGPARLIVHEARVDLDRSSWRDGRIETSGRVSGWRYGRAQANEPPLELRAEWSLKSGDTLDGRLLVERVGGDLFGGSPSQRTSMGLTELRLLATAHGRQIDVQFSGSGSHSGHARATARLEAERGDDGWRIAQDRALTGNIDADVPSLDWADRVLSANLRENIRVAGAARAQLRISGTPRQPRVDGPVEADGLRVAWVEQGLRLENGQVRARLTSDASGRNELRIDEARFSGGPRARPPDRRIAAAIPADHQGTLEASGTIRLPAVEGVVQVSMQKFPMLQRADRWLVATGGANLVFSAERAQLNGAAVVDAGFIDVSRRNAPTLADDVIVRRKTDATGDPPVAERTQFTFDFDVTADLGPAFVLRGSGLDTRIAGELRVRHDGKGLVRASGTLNTRDGTYEGYGQKLAIRRGRVLFQGPIDNPGLDILALRTGLPVDVGISVTRTAQHPLVRLYSDPAMSDIETLSWLVLGRQPEEGRGDNAALASAALGLLGGSGESMPTTIARRLGIDEISIRSGTTESTNSLLPRQSVAGRLRPDTTNTLTSDIVTIGKRLSDDVTLSYEQVVGGSGGVAQLAYRLSRRFSVVARAGTENALDLVWSMTFD